MIDDVGVFRTTIELASLNRPDDRRAIEAVMVDTGSENSWAPEELLAELGISPVRVDKFETASGEILERPVGFALVHVAGRVAPGVVAFARQGDMVLLGAQTLEGLNLRVDLTRRELIPGGPLPAALANSLCAGVVRGSLILGGRSLEGLDLRIDPSELAAAPYNRMT